MALEVFSEEVLDVAEYKDSYALFSVRVDCAKRLNGTNPALASAKLVLQKSLV